MAVLRAANEPFFDGRGTGRCGKQQTGIDSLGGEGPVNLHPIRILADHRRQAGAGPQTSDHVGDIGGSPQSAFVLVRTQENDRRFLANPFGVAPEIAVENRVPQHEGGGVAEAGK